MAEINGLLNRRFTLSSGAVTTLVFPTVRAHGIDVINLSSTETVYFMEDAPVSSSDSLSIKLLPGMSFTFSGNFTKINFYSPGGADVQAVPRGNKL